MRWNFTPWLASMALILAVVAVSDSCVLGNDLLVVKRHASWRYHAAKEGPGDGWQTPEYDDSQWKQGSAGFGYGDNDDRTVLDDMLNNFTSVYLRTTF